MLKKKIQITNAETHKTSDGRCGHTIIKVEQWRLFGILFYQLIQEESLSVK